MTENFKKQLLNIITDNQKRTVGDDDQHIIDINQSIIDIKSQLPNETINILFNEVIKTPEKFGQYFILYGGYITSQISTTVSEANGLICILDSKCNIIKVFTEFKNGTKLRFIDKLIVDDDGNFYAVDCSYYSNYTNDSEKRFIMLNNFITSNIIYEDYCIILQKSYILGYSFSKCHNLIKSPLSSSFIFITEVSGFIDFDTSYNNSILIISLKLNVGSENEWKTYISSKITNFVGCYSEFNKDDNYDYVVISGSDNAKNLKVIRGNQDGINEYNLSYNKDTLIYNGAVFNNCDEFYFKGDNIISTNPDIWKHYIFKCVNKNVTTILAEESSLRWLYEFVKNNNNIYVYKKAYNSENGSSELYFSKMKNDKFEFSKIMEIEGSLSSLLVAVSNNYNLITHYCFFHLYSNLTNQYGNVYFREIYNPNNYNGLPYIDNNSLIPHSVVIKSDNQVCFARNLYNKTINNNTTTSTIEIPNTYLNNTNIDTKILLSETNLPLIENNDHLIKNVYETVYLNFINSLLIQDRNDLSDINNNLNASIYLNQKLNISDEYDNAKIYNKAILYFENGTVEEKEYEFADRSDKSVFIRMMIYVSEKIRRIEFISNDKKTIYHTINANNLEKGKLYKISQKLEVL